MTVTAVEANALSKDDIAAIKQADHVVFRHYRGKTTVEVGLTSMVEQRIYSAAEQRLFPVTDHGSADRSRIIEVTGNLREDKTGFAMIHSAKYSETWQTIVGLLKASDEVSLVFSEDRHTNDYIRDAGLHADALRMYVRRGTRKMVFAISTSVTPDNSARMIKTA